MLVGFAALGLMAFPDWNLVSVLTPVLDRRTFSCDKSSVNLKQPTVFLES